MDCVTVVELFYTAEQETLTEFKVSMSAFSFRKDKYYNCHTVFTGIDFYTSVSLFIVIYEMTILKLHLVPLKFVNRDSILHSYLC